jgi:hypothetical protein
MFGNTKAHTHQAILHDTFIYKSDDTVFGSRGIILQHYITQGKL